MVLLIKKSYPNTVTTCDAQCMRCLPHMETHAGTLHVAACIEPNLLHELLAPPATYFTIPAAECTWIGVAAKLQAAARHCACA